MKYRNKLPVGYRNWTEFYLKISKDYPGIKTGSYYFKTLSYFKENDYLRDTLEYDTYSIGIKFLKLRVLEELGEIFFKRENLELIHKTLDINFPYYPYQSLEDFKIKDQLRNVISPILYNLRREKY